MADNLGPNGLVVAAGKCAGPIPAENCANAQKKMWVDIMTGFGPAYFLHEVQFSAGIGPAHFPAETTRPLGPRLSAIFTLL